MWMYSIRQPLGVVAGITPFNFPPWCRCGCSPTPSPVATLRPQAVREGPSASLLIADLLKQAGLPDGVFSVIQGDKVAVDRILEHPDIAAVSFVGSTPIARYIYETGTRNGKRVQALGGAKNHMVVLPDADIDMAADAAVSAGYGSAGERCMAISVVVAVGQVADPLVEAIKARLPKLRTAPARSRTARWAPSSPASTGTRWRATSTPRPSRAPTSSSTVVEVPGDGFFLGVSLLDDVGETMDCYRDEIFGPVLGVVRVDTYEEALRLVNDNQYGNGTAIFTRDGGAPISSSSTSTSAWWASTCPFPSPSRTTASAAGRRRCSATPTCTARTASTSTPAARS